MSFCLAQLTTMFVVVKFRFLRQKDGGGGSGVH